MVSGRVKFENLKNAVELTGATNFDVSSGVEIMEKKWKENIRFI